MHSSRLVLLLALVGVATAGHGAADAAAQSPQARAELAGLLTRAEATNYRETSRYADVVAFLEEVTAADPRMHMATFGYSYEGRALPMVVMGTGLADPSPESVMATGKLRVWVQGNIHGGEVEGKEVMQMMLRELARGAHSDWFDSVVLLVAPIYNADGNERVRLDNRGAQHGPIGGTGQRPNALDFDLNRDHMKLDTPEARSLVRMMTAYDPHLSVDLHTTNGTRHAYHLTYSPPLHPNTDAGIDRFLRDRLFPAVTGTIQQKHGWHFYHYGNAMHDPRTDQRAWMTFDHRPRFGTNYVGLRHRMAILSEAYSYATFEDRTKATYWFVEEILDFAAGNAAEIRRIVDAAAARELVGEELAVVAEPLRTPGMVDILMGDVATERNPYTGRPMLRRLDVVRPESMVEYIAFQPLETERAPRAYLIPPEVDVAVERMEAHGIETTTLTAPRSLRAEVFHVDSTRASERPFQGHNERAVWGRWVEEERSVPAGTVVVRVDRPLGLLAFMLLEPRSDDGLVNWALLDDFIQAGSPYPILRTFQEP